jgi:hypothetical protein
MATTQPSPTAQAPTAQAPTAQAEHPSPRPQEMHDVLKKLEIKANLCRSAASRIKMALIRMGRNCDSRRLLELHCELIRIAEQCETEANKLRTIINVTIESPYPGIKRALESVHDVSIRVAVFANSMALTTAADHANQVIASAQSMVEELKRLMRASTQALKGHRSRAAIALNRCAEVVKTATDVNENARKALEENEAHDEARRARLRAQVKQRLDAHDKRRGITKDNDDDT